MNAPIELLLEVKLRNFVVLKMVVQENRHNQIFSQNGLTYLWNVHKLKNSSKRGINVPETLQFPKIGSIIHKKIVSFRSKRGKSRYGSKLSKEN